MKRVNYKRIGDFIQLMDERNADLEVTTLLGLSISKDFIPSVANTVGTNMARYKIIRKNHFACSLMQVRRDKKVPVALLKDYDAAIISQAYPIFKVVDEGQLSPDYLMMWMSRTEFDRHACFLAVGGVRGSLEWDDFLDMPIPVPSIQKQREIVKEYNTIVKRIRLNEQLNQKLEETAQAIYKHWFVDFEFPIDNNLSPDGEMSEGQRGYKSSGGKMVWNEELGKEIPVGWEDGYLSDIAKIVMGQSPNGESYNTIGKGEVFYQGRTDFGYRFPKVRYYTTEPKRRAKEADILMSVRAPVGDLNIAISDCVIGRGVASLRSVSNCDSFLFYLMQEVKIQFDIANDEGTVFGSITKDGLHEIKVLKPSQNIVERFEILVKFIDQKIKRQCQEINLLSKTQDLLLSKMTKV